MPQPVFIVGVPRSGTTLLAAMLNGHALYSCGAETQFFPHLDRAGDAASLLRDWPERATQFLETLSVSGESVCGLYGLGARDIEERLRGRAPSVRAMFECLPALRCSRQGKERWAEKSPNHLLYLERIRSIWPSAPVIRIVRDPRDSASSMRKLPWASDEILPNLFLWDEWNRRSERFFLTDRHCWTVRYEDLITSPQRTCEDLCSFLGVPFAQSMLDLPHASEGLSARSEWWKQDVAKTVDSTRLEMWRRDVKPEEVRAANVLLRESLADYRYPVDDLDAGPPIRREVWLYPLTRQFAEKHSTALRGLLLDGVRVRALTSLAHARGTIRREALVLQGLPGENGWSLAGDRVQRAASLARLTALLAERRALGAPTTWLPPAGRTGSIAAAVAARLLSSCRAATLQEAVQ